MNGVTKIVCMLVLILFSGVVYGQSLEELRKEVENAEEEIRLTNELLSKTKSDKKSSQNQLRLIQNKIRNRKNIVSNLEKQSSLITKDITDKSGTVKQLEDTLQILRKEYGDMVYDAYKNYKLNNFLVFLFASKDFNDATKRIAYMRRYNRMREMKAAEIDSVSMRITGQITELQGKKDDLVKVQQTRQNEIATLGKDEAEYKTSVNKLNKEESRLASQIKTKQQELNRIQQQIKKMVAAQAKKDSKAPRSAAEEEYIATLSGQFDQNKGKLPYPVSGGVIVDGWGMHPHPTQKGIMVNNTGIDIAAQSGAKVKAVFEGEVRNVFYIQGFNNNVMIRHGNYYTVYSKLEKVSVKTGDKVALNQVIGSISSSDNSDDHVLHFEIWRETTNLNPTTWLRR